MKMCAWQPSVWERYKLRVAMRYEAFRLWTGNYPWMVSAGVAKSRLNWCVATRRAGGYWMESGEKLRKVTLPDGGYSYQSYKRLLRWVAA